jgi:hypothetical protein
MPRRAPRREAASPAVPVLIACALAAGIPSLAWAQAKSGPYSVDACTTPTQAKLETAIGARVKSQKVPPSTPTSAGVSVCMWATPDGRRTLSVSTYAPAAVRNTQAKTIDTYFESLKVQNASLSGRPRVIAGVKKRAVSFPSARGVGDVVLVLRSDCTVVINAAGFKPEAIAGIARSAGEQ